MTLWFPSSKSIEKHFNYSPYRKLIKGRCMVNKICEFNIPQDQNRKYLVNIEEVYKTTEYQPCAIEQFFKNNPKETSVMLVCHCPKCSGPSGRM